MLRKERENMEGNAKERENQLRREIEDWKRKLTEKDQEMKVLEGKLRDLERDRNDRQREVDELKARIMEREKRIEELEGEVRRTRERLEMG